MLFLPRKDTFPQENKSEIYNQHLKKMLNIQLTLLLMEQCG